tara:strand:- start:363 stop:662 length:300 start_codon:yes stop_codon:yes gene_type:complete
LVIIYNVNYCVELIVRLLIINNLDLKMFKKNFLEILRWGLRLHGVGHLVEVFTAVAEGAFITACVALTFITIEILASFYLPKEHVHFKPIKSDVHEDCN